MKKDSGFPMNYPVVNLGLDQDMIETMKSFETADIIVNGNKKKLTKQ